MEFLIGLTLSCTFHSLYQEISSCLLFLLTINESGENQQTDIHLQFIKRLVIRDHDFFSDELECSVTGIQFAGVHLRELQKSFKNPAANLGLIFEEATKRAIRSVGLGSPPSLSEYVHPNLLSSAALAAKASIKFLCTTCRIHVTVLEQIDM